MQHHQVKTPELLTLLSILPQCIPTLRDYRKDSWGAAEWLPDTGVACKLHLLHCLVLLYVLSRPPARWSGQCAFPPLSSFCPCQSSCHSPVWSVHIFVLTGSGPHVADARKHDGTSSKHGQRWASYGIVGLKTFSGRQRGLGGRGYRHFCLSLFAGFGAQVELPCFQQQFRWLAL